MSSTGLAPSTTTRTVLRVLGFVLLAVGIVLAINGGMGVADTSDSFDGPSNSALAKLVIGMFMVVFGLAALSFGFLGAQARYAAGEAMPVVKDSLTYLKDEGKTGPFCSKCGVRNDADAKFCDSCGAALA
ncbi:zinc ribbon domain-containing protein [Nocardioides sp. CN2-186]|uniref:zinc ribbon domain-containing protein n=1 Tax=Nocardioides tweenelious TaxID=3156607 RepID=UPI0032B328CD